MTDQSLQVHATLVAMLDDTARRFPQRRALFFEGAALTYAQMRRAVSGLAGLLAAQVPAGTRIATVLGNSLVAALAPYAIAQAGCVHVPLNPLYTARELGFILGDAQPALVLADEGLAAVTEAIAAQPARPALLPASQVLAHLASWCDDAVDAASQARPVDADSIALIQYTGGSTGKPKGVQLSHRAVNANCAQREALLPVAQGCETVLCVMPLFHSYAMSMGLALAAYSAATLVVLAAYRPERVLDAIEEHGVTIFPGSPTLFVGLMGSERFASTSWARVHTCYSGSAALSEETLRTWEAKTGSRVYEGYGQTEAGPILTFNPVLGVAKIGSVGIPVPETQVQIVDLEDGTRILPPGERGEIRARGPQLMAGYLNLPQETAESLRGGWLYTGDIGEMDADGYLYIRDRKKDLVIISGYNVYPREVEEVLYGHPDVLEAAVVGQPDAYRGEILVAWLACKPGRPLPSDDDLRAFCSGQLAKYKVPAQFRFLAALPKTSVNKIDKKPLRTQHDHPSRLR